MTFIENEEEMEGESEDFPHLVPLELPDGRVTVVTALHYPIVSEWEWHYDAAHGRVVREDGGRVVFLYDELIKLSALSEDSYPLLSRQAIRKLYVHLPAFRATTALVGQQRGIAARLGGYAYPSSFNFISNALSFCFLQYYRWENRGTSQVFTREQTLLPGHYTEGPIRAKYLRLGAWMDNEYTGGWVADAKEPTGLAPEPIRVPIGKGLRGLWKMMLLEANEGEIDVDGLSEVLSDKGRSVNSLVSHLSLLAGHYPIP